MAVTVKITSKGLFNKVKSINLKDILDNCNLKYGSNNEFYILKENEMKDLIPYITPLYDAGLDGVIVQDLGLISFLKENLLLPFLFAMYFLLDL